MRKYRHYLISKRLKRYTLAFIFILICQRNELNCLEFFKDYIDFFFKKKVISSATESKNIGSIQIKKLKPPLWLGELFFVLSKRGVVLSNLITKKKCANFDT